jgi:asparagine synthase (glutamine-hydrolysing)
VCGISGLFDPARSTGTDVLATQAADMAATLVHRGPDDHGLWVDGDAGVALSHRRLSVVDLSPLGHQPMVSGDGRWTIVYNGEVYNAGDLRDRLGSEGMAFRGTSDTEVLLGAVQAWGVTRAFEAGEGMFAVALWDRRERQLHLVRDRFGEKPLYYGWVGGSLAFASELKAIAVLPGFTPELDRGAVALYLRHNCVPGVHSIYQGIRKLAPGTLVTFSSTDRAGVLPAPVPYWSARTAVEDALAHPLSGSPEELTDRLEAVLTRSVADRMVADVPVGAFLSGGIDSSVVVALMQQSSSRPVRTFTIGFDDRAFDESGEARGVADHLGTDHTALRVTEDDAADVIPDLPGIWDEPFADTSQIPVLLVSRLARSQVTVSLSGDGGDELFAGYNRHVYLERLWGQASRLPDPVRRSLGAALVRVPPGVVDSAARLTAVLPASYRVRNPAIKVAKLGKVLAATGPEDAYLGLVSHWAHPESMVLGANGDASLAARPEDWPRLPTVTEQMLWLDLVGYLPDDILTKVDRAAMSTSLETRVPFLDRSVFDLAWRLPMDLKLRDGVTKWILRQVLYRYVPRELVDRPKMGFGLPIGSWLRGPLRPWAEELVSERRLASQGLLDPAPVRRAWQLHVTGRRDLAHELWDVIALQAWLDRWMPGFAA